MSDSLFIAWKYLCFNRLKTAILVSVISLTLFLPAGVDALVDESARQLRRRAQETPLLIGAKGSEAELVLNSLYFQSKPPVEASMKAVDRVRATGYADAIPLYVRFRARETPIVGTTLDYFFYRGRTIQNGRQFAMLGECVVGAEAAESLGLSPGQSLISQPESLFDLAGVYPLKLNVVGVLEPSASPDDSAIFVDVKTAWIIAGLGHGHQDLTQETSADSLLEKEGNRLTANASVLTYTVITPETASSFHFHGDVATFPLTGVIALPKDQRASTLLMGRFQSAKDVLQIVQPTTVMEDLLATVLRVRNVILVGAMLLGLATLGSVLLVFALSLRIRQQELLTMRRIGASPRRTALIVAWEVLIVLFISGGIALACTFATRRFSGDAIQWFLL